MNLNVLNKVWRSESSGLSMLIPIDYNQMVSTSDNTRETVLESTVLPEYGMIKQLVACQMDSMPVSFDMVQYTDLAGNYVGDEDTAQELMRRGIVPTVIDDDHKVCSIGYCEKEDAWYGWSHRAINKFTPGSEVKFGDCAYVPATFEDFKAKVRHEYKDDMYQDVTIESVGNDEVKVDYYIDSVTGKRIGGSQKYKFEPGRGAWLANDIDDARTMACDFAKSVSSSVVESEVFPYVNYKPNTLVDCFKNILKHMQSESSTVSRIDLLKQAKRQLMSVSSPLKVLKDSELTQDSFAWYEYNNNKPASYDHHAKNFEMEIEKGEYFGITYDAKRQVVLIQTSDAFERDAGKLMTFQISKRQAQNLIKKSIVPRVVKINGKAYIRGNGDPEQSFHGNPNITTSVQVKHSVAPKEQMQEIRKEERAASKITTAYLAYYVADLFKKNVNVVVGDTIEELKGTLDRYMSRAKDLASPAIILAVSTDNPFYIKASEQRGQSTFMRMAHIQQIQQSALKHVDTYLPDGLDVKSGDVEGPAVRTDLPTRKEPIIFGMEIPVLAELRDFIIQDEYFTKSFKVIGKFGGIGEIQGRPVLKLVAKKNDKAHQLEAEALVRRVEKFYITNAGIRFKAVRGHVKTAQTRKEGEVIVVIFEVKVPVQWRGEHAERAKKLLLMEHQGLLNRTIRYSIKLKSGLMRQVNVTGIDYQRALIKVKTIRESENYEVTELYDVKGEKRIL